MSDYIVDLKYSSDIKKSQDPVRLDYIRAIMQGVPMLSQNSYRYLDIGCGQGNTLVALAAANPDAVFFGVDINKEHIEAAKSTAKYYELENVTFIGCDIKELQELELPDFDFIATHGMYSWIPLDVRKALLDYVALKLSENGLFYIHYAVLPGRSAIGPVWKIMQEFTSDIEGSYNKTSKSLELIRSLLDLDKGYFQAYEIAKTRAEALFSQQIEYIAHESMNESWQANYHFEICREMASRELFYVGHARHVRNYPEYTVPVSLQEQFARAPSDEIRQTLIDYIDLNPSRVDIYSKAGPGRSSQDRIYPHCYFGRDYYSDNAPADVVLANGIKLDFSPAIYGKLLAVLYARPSTLDNLYNDKDLTPYSSHDIEEAILKLLVAGQIQIYRNKPEEIIFREFFRISLVSPFNQKQIYPDNWVQDGTTLVSPVTGSTVRIQFIEAVLLYVLSMEPSLSVEQKVVQILQSETVKQLVQHGVKISDKSIENNLPLFVEQRLWKFIQLGIVTLDD